ncbi:hypothetical protein P170DRAFT_511042 [Aspergillus steynii IBT 23096]|uniref:Zn(2)-C6 fungal-type domain-containing protein n=1 Tax=Aspergillus steynii IBT 23096 TaxID=1392250 RepID=A0A2I2G6F2_9EURO|nr:uncharacterized protein P170DRAFT_511042 [Aspergillus steynii IBT 23096]PLB48449.1 hypothetical protein P170DRAFT_511042 [Aspergillus steynii IBT 23096]
MADSQSVGPGSTITTPSAQDPKPPKSQSCVTCQRRKVKCSRQEPCAACTKNGVQCVYRPHQPPRRRKRNIPDASLAARLDRYGNSVDPEACSPTRAVPSPGRGEVVSTPVASVAELANPRGPLSAVGTSNPSHAGSRRLVSNKGSSVYLDSNLWTSVSDELQEAQDAIQESSSAESDQSGQNDNSPAVGDESGWIFSSPGRTTLSAIHPNPVHIFKLWQTFLENVNPLIKILHAPVVQQQLLEAAGDLPTVSKEMEALMFSIYCISVISLSEDEVKRSYGESRATLISRYKRSAETALRNAGMLKTSNMMMLQALLLYLFSLRLLSDPHTLWSLCGIAMRIAQRIGLHKDGSHLGLSVYETEMRRRLCLQLVIFDATAGYFSGCGSASFIPPTPQTTLPPLNINDSNLDPNMTDPPREYTGPTEMVFCLVRHEFGEWLRNRAGMSSGFDGGHWGFLRSSSVPLSEKDAAIDELEQKFETKYLRHCDVSIPLHFITVMMARSVVCMIRLAAHHPRQYTGTSMAGVGDSKPAQHTLQLSEAERDRIFTICVQVAENCDAVQTNHATKKYLWHVDYNIQWDALIYMLSELRGRRVEGAEVARAWALINSICGRHYRQMGPRARRSTLHVAIRSLIIKAWKGHVVTCQQRGIPSQPCPELVAPWLQLGVGEPQTVAAAPPPLSVPLHQQEAPSSRVLYHAENTQQPLDGESSLAGNTNGTSPPLQSSITAFQQQGPVTGIGVGTGAEELDFAAIGGVPTLDVSPMNWEQWDDLLQQFQQECWNENPLLSQP